MLLSEIQVKEYTVRASNLHARMRLAKGSKFERKSRKSQSVALIAAALAFKDHKPDRDGKPSKVTRTSLARLFSKAELSNSGGGAVQNWEILIDEFDKTYDCGEPLDAVMTNVDDIEFAQDDMDEALEELGFSIREDTSPQSILRSFSPPLDAAELAAILDQALPASVISSLQQAIRLPTPVVRILSSLLQDDAPADDGALRKYFEEKMIVLVQQLRPVELGDGHFQMLCHHECTDEPIDKMRAFGQTLAAQADGTSSKLLGFSFDIERRILETHPKLAPKLAAGLLLRILSTVASVEPTALDGHDGLKTLLKSAVRSPRASPTGGGSPGHGTTALDEETTTADHVGDESCVGPTGPPRAWLTPERLATEHGIRICSRLGEEWIDIGDEDLQSPADVATKEPAPPPLRAPPDSSISSSIAAHVANAVAEPHDHGTLAQVGTPRTAPSTSDGLSSMTKYLDLVLVGGELPMCAAPLEASRLTLESGPGNKLGSGAFSVVLKGVLDGRQPVAVKRLHGYYFEEKSKVQFLKEMAVLQRAARECSRVCRFLGTVLLDDQPSIVMKRYPQSLRDVLANDPSRRLPESLAVELSYQLACALGELHGLVPAILVLDLKPANLLLDANGLLHVADFGVSKILSETATLGTTLGTDFASAVGGTPFYMSPEQLQAEHVGKPADIYGFGAVVYEMMVGEPPHAASADGRALKPVQVLMKVCVEKATPAALSGSAPLFSPALAELARRCLAFEPSARPTAVEARDALVVDVKMCKPTTISALEERREGYDTGTRDSELRTEALRCAGEVEEGVPASMRPWLVNPAEHLSLCLGTPRREAFATMRANVSTSPQFACNPDVSARILELEAAEAAKDEEVVVRFRARCDEFNKALCKRLADAASNEAAASVAAIESLATDPHDTQHTLNQRLRPYDVSEPDGVNSGSLEREFYLSCCGPMLQVDDSAMVQLAALKYVLADELATSRQALFEALQKRSKKGFERLNIRQCPECKRGWSDAGGCQWRMCGAPHVGKGEMRLHGSADDRFAADDLVFTITEKKFDDNGDVVESKPTVKAERFFGVRRSEAFGTMHPRDNPATIAERFEQQFGITHDAEKLHHGCGYMGWFPDWKPVDLDDL